MLTMPVVLFTQRARLSLVLLICVILSACATAPPPTAKAMSPADVIMQYFRKQPIDSDFRATRVVHDDTLLAQLPMPTRDAITQYPQQAAALLNALAQQQDIELALLDSVASYPQHQDVLTYIALTLYPGQQQPLIDKLLLNDAFSEQALLEGALLAQVDPTTLFPMTASGDQQVQLKPLFHSIGITVFQQTPDTRIEVSFRVQGSEVWQSGHPLQWAPQREAMAGSIVRLLADTEYEIRLRIFVADNLQDEQFHRVRTWPEEPPINPDLVYALEDIYNGGQLDLELLNIEGSPDGWAKIIGSPDTPIVADELDDQAINIGDNSYILFENVVVKGGRRYAVRSKLAHHLWFRGCDLSEFGRTATVEQNGLAYERSDDSQPINYDAGFFFEKTGVVVVEYCDVHSPNPAANHWGNGHPRGASAYLTFAYHPESQFSGQHVVRYNRFFGSDTHRFNDVIESRSNGREWGGFAGHSAVHDNYLAYANDDIIEIDGGMTNVLVYNNDIEQGFVGISAIPNMRGPAYIFNNYIHNLGDQRGTSWAAIKLGGLITKPAGITLLFDNLIISNGVGVGASKFQGDSTYWLDARNNILLMSKDWNALGKGIYDVGKYSGSYLANNFIYNTHTKQPEFDALIDMPFYDPTLLNDAVADSIAGSEGLFAMPMPVEQGIANFSRFDGAGNLLIGVVPPHSSGLPLVDQSGDDGEHSADAAESAAVTTIKQSDGEPPVRPEHLSKRQ